MNAGNEHMPLRQEIVGVLTCVFATLCASGQLVGPGPDFPQFVATIQPNLAEMEKRTSPLNDNVAILAESLIRNARNEGVRAERLAICDQLAKEEMPFLLDRWVTFTRILLASRENRKDELIQTARQWLEWYPNSYELLPEWWRERHRNEPDANVILRMEVARILEYVVNDQLNWSPRERIDLVEEFMSPLLEEDVTDQYSREAIRAKRQFARCIGKLYEWDLNQQLEDLAKAGGDQEAIDKLASQFPEYHLRGMNRQREIYESLLPVLESISRDADALFAVTGVGKQEVDEVLSLTQKSLSTIESAIGRIEVYQKKPKGEVVESSVAGVFEESAAGDVSR